MSDLTCQGYDGILFSELKIGKLTVLRRCGLHIDSRRVELLAIFEGLQSSLIHHFVLV